MAFLEEVTAGFDVGYEICVLASHCAWKNPDSLVKDVLEAIGQNRYHPFAHPYMLCNVATHKSGKLDKANIINTRLMKSTQIFVHETVLQVRAALDLLCASHFIFLLLDMFSHFYELELRRLSKELP